MKSIIQQRLGDVIRPKLVSRRLALFACALAVCGINARSVLAQPSNLHAAFDEVDTHDLRESEPWPGAVRLAAVQQKPAAASPKPAAPPAARKPPAKKASPPHATESQS